MEPLQDGYPSDPDDVETAGSTDTSRPISEQEARALVRFAEAKASDEEGVGQGDDEYVAAKTAIIGQAESQGLIIPAQFKPITDRYYVAQLNYNVYSLVRNGTYDDTDQAYESIGVTATELGVMNIIDSLAEAQLLWSGGDEAGAVRKRDDLLGRVLASDVLTDNARIDWTSFINNQLKDTIGTVAMTKEIVAHLLKKDRELTDNVEIYLNAGQEFAGQLYTAYGNHECLNSLLTLILALAELDLEKSKSLENPFPGIVLDVDAHLTGQYNQFLNDAKEYAQSLGMSEAELSRYLKDAVKYLNEHGYKAVD